jgi:hypothetical protein
VPTVALFTRAFEGLAEAVCRGQQMPDLARVIVPHPLNDRPEGEVRAVVTDRIEEIIGKLTRPA